jgi:hypothetical protein
MCSVVEILDVEGMVHQPFQGRRATAASNRGGGNWNRERGKPKTASNFRADPKICYGLAAHATPVPFYAAACRPGPGDIDKSLFSGSNRE